MRALWIALLVLAALPAWAQFAVEFELATIEVGVASETQAVRRLGQGFIIEKPGGGRVRVYADAARTKSMYVTCSADGLVEQVQVVQGLLRPYTSAMRCNLPPAMWHTRANIGLGMSARRVRATYGEPTQETDIGGLHWFTYKTDFSRDRRVRLMYQASFGFKDNRLTRIMLHNGN